MPRPKSIKPSHCHHRPTSRGYVRIDGKMLYTGTWGTQAAKDEYDRLIGEWIANGRKMPQDASNAVDGVNTGVSVNQVLAAFLLYARDYYKRPDGSPGTEYRNIIDAMHYVRKLYGKIPAANFGPKALKVVRQAMIDGEPAGIDGQGGRLGWCRTHVNRQIARIKIIFKWAVAQEMISPIIYQGLQAVPGLRVGKSEARESKPVKPANEGSVHAILPYVSDQVGAMIRLQLLTGARAGELCIMRSCDIDRSGKVWIYRPEHHKTQHHGHGREIMIGPKAQEVLAPFLKPNLQAFCFSPADAEQARHEEQRANRKTAVQPSQVKRTILARRRNRRRPPANHYTVDSYRRAIVRACDQTDREQREQADKQGVTVAGRLVERFHPHQLRHNAATSIRREFGLEAAQVILGHKTLAVTQIYAEKDVAAAKRIMEQVG